MLIYAKFVLVGVVKYTLAKKGQWKSRSLAPQTSVGQSQSKLYHLLCGSKTQTKPTTTLPTFCSQSLTHSHGLSPFLFHSP